MKKNLYYQTVFQRKNYIIELLTNFFFGMASYPRLMLEVFVRKNFGERYFNMASVYTLVFLLGLTPLLYSGIFQYIMSMNRYHHYSFDWSPLFKHYWAWYIFLAFFIFFSRKRAREVKRNPSTFDFEKFSLYSGDVNMKFFTLGGRNWDIRQVETKLEPGLFFIIGVVIWQFISLNLGLLLMICSVFYSLSYWATYQRGRNFVLGKIDEMISNEEMFNSFVKKEAPEKTKGFRFFGDMPIDEDKREKLVDYFFEYTDDEPGVAR